MTKTLADLLREDGAQEGDVYEACGLEWELNDALTLVAGKRRAPDSISIHRQSTIPADGWRRVSPRKPLRVEFKQTVVELPGYQPAIYSDVLEDLVGKRVRVTVEALGEEVGE